MAVGANIKTALVVVACVAGGNALGLVNTTQISKLALHQNQGLHRIVLHQNDALQSILCYLEKRTLISKTVPDNQKVQSLHTLDQIDRVGRLAPCTNLPNLPKHAR